MKLKYLILTALLTSCAHTKNYTYISRSVKPVINQLYNFNKIQNKTVEQCNPNKQTLGLIIKNVFNSGFLKQTNEVKKEILNNSYGIFKHETQLCDDGLACFIHNSYSVNYKAVDTILFDEENFCEKNEDLAKIVFLNETLTHELFHDFWYNLLTDEERQMFKIDAKHFYYDIISSWSTSDELKILKRIGVKNPLPMHFKPYLKLALSKAYYSDEKFFGTEMFARLAAGTYALDIIMPKQFRKYYNKLIKSKALNRDSM